MSALDDKHREAVAQVSKKTKQTINRSQFCAKSKTFKFDPLPRLLLRFQWTLKTTVERLCSLHDLVAPLQYKNPKRLLWCDFFGKI